MLFSAGALLEPSALMANLCLPVMHYSWIILFLSFLLCTSDAQDDIDNTGS